jgi:hypothetical protein
LALEETVEQVTLHLLGQRVHLAQLAYYPLGILDLGVAQEEQLVLLPQVQVAEQMVNYLQQVEQHNYRKAIMVEQQQMVQAVVVVAVQVP